MDHAMAKVDRLLVVFGGYYFNHHYDDTWLFNTSSRQSRGDTVEPVFLVRYTLSCCALGSAESKYNHSRLVLGIAKDPRLYV